MHLRPATPPPAARVLSTWISRADAGLLRGAVANAAMAVVDEQRRRSEWTSDEARALVDAVTFGRRTA